MRRTSVSVTQGVDLWSINGHIQGYYGLHGTPLTDQDIFKNIIAQSIGYVAEWLHESHLQQQPQPQIHHHHSPPFTAPITDP
jgi:hypothetical protein